MNQLSSSNNMHTTQRLKYIRMIIMISSHSSWKVNEPLQLEMGMQLTIHVQ